MAHHIAPVDSPPVSDKQRADLQRREAHFPISHATLKPLQPTLESNGSPYRLQDPPQRRQDPRDRPRRLPKRARRRDLQRRVERAQVGYRHIDTAQFYRNEADVGKAIADAGLAREEVFVTSKYIAGEWSYDDVLRAVKESVERIGGGYIDLYLLHAPANPVGRADAWRALEDAQSQGLLRDIGVSNYSEAHLKKLAETWRVKSAVNQVELHPWLTREELVKYHHSVGIHLEAYSPLAKAYKLKDPVVTEIAAQLNAEPAQVLVAWSLAKDFITLPKSVNPTRQQQNLDSYKVKLSDERIAKLDALDEYLTTGWDPVKQHAV